MIATQIPCLVAKISLRLPPEKENPEGCPIVVYVTHKGERARMFLPVRIRRKDWNERDGSVRKTHPHHQKINAYLSDTLTRGEQAIMDAIVSRKSIRPRDIIDALRATEDATGDVFEYWRSYMAQLEARERWGTRSQYNVTLQKLVAFQKKRGRSKLLWEDIDLAFLEAFETSMTGKADGTIHGNLKRLRAMLYRGIRDGHFPQEKNPFFIYKLKQPRKSKRKKVILLDDIQKLRDARLTGRRNDARNCFIFAFYEGGVRISDMLLLRPENIVEFGGAYRVEYGMIKTGEESESVPLFPPAEKILREYGWPNIEAGRFIFPFMPNGVAPGSKREWDLRSSKTSQVNNNLRKLQKELGISTHLTTHVARHSFTNVLKAAGFTTRDMMEILRHQNEKTTEAYIESVIRGVHDERIREALLP